MYFSISDLYRELKLIDMEVHDLISRYAACVLCCLLLRLCFIHRILSSGNADVADLTETGFAVKEIGFEFGLPRDSEATVRNDSGQTSCWLYRDLEAVLRCAWKFELAFAIFQTTRKK